MTTGRIVTVYLVGTYNSPARGFEGSADPSGESAARSIKPSQLGRRRSVKPV